MKTIFNFLAFLNKLMLFCHFIFKIHLNLWYIFFIHQISEEEQQKIAFIKLINTYTVKPNILFIFTFTHI